MSFKTLSTLALLATLVVFQAQAESTAHDDPSIQAISGGVASLDPTTPVADQGDSNKWGWGPWGYRRWGYGYPFYGYGYDYRPYGWWY